MNVRRGPTQAGFRVAVRVLTLRGLSRLAAFSRTPLVYSPQVPPSIQQRCLATGPATRAAIKRNAAMRTRFDAPSALAVIGYLRYLVLLLHWRIDRAHNGGSRRRRIEAGRIAVQRQQPRGAQSRSPLRRRRGERKRPPRRFTARRP